MLGTILKGEIKDQEKNSSYRIGGVSNNSSDHIRRVVSNFSDLSSEGIVPVSRSLEHLKVTPLIISKELKVTPPI
jgi:hypothetical protein